MSEIISRLAFEEEATDALKKMIKELKSVGSFVNPTQKGLASAIINRYYEKFFEGEKKKLEELFFDPQKEIKFHMETEKDPVKLSRKLERPIKYLKRLEANQKDSKKNVEAS